MADTSFDLIVIGGGPGGYVAAIRAAQLGMKTAVVEREHLGGICLNWGCIPTKALLRSSEINHLLHNLDQYGFSAKDVTFDTKKVVERSRKVAKQLSNGVAFLLKKNKVTVFDGAAKLAGKGKVAVTKDGKSIADLAAKNIIIASGARARVLPGLEPDSKLVWTYKEAMVPPSMPKSVLVVGSGAIGIEFASFYRNMGAEVTVVEVLDRVVPAEDEEISALARKSFEKQGMKIHTGAVVKALKRNANSVAATIEAGGKSLEVNAERVVLAVGIVAMSRISASKAPRSASRRRISWSINGSPPTSPASTPSAMSWDRPGSPTRRAMRASSASRKSPASTTSTRSIPPMFRAAPIACRRSPASASPRRTRRKPAIRSRSGGSPISAMARRSHWASRKGMVKTIFDAKTGELLGAHMIGAEVTELIQGFGIAKTLETTEVELMHAIFPHPTLSEMMHESVLDAFGKVIHI